MNKEIPHPTILSFSLPTSLHTSLLSLASLFSLLAYLQSYAGALSFVIVYHTSFSNLIRKLERRRANIRGEMGIRREKREEKRGERREERGERRVNLTCRKM